MLITNCLAYEDIKVKLSPVNDSFNLSIDANKVEISLTLNYLQLKTLGDSLISMANTANASELHNAIGKDFVGDIKVYYQQELEQKITEINLENITEDIAKRVLCLPLYVDLTLEEVDMISRLMLRIQNN